MASRVTCDAVTSPPNTSSDGLDLLMTAYVTPSPTTVFYSCHFDAVRMTFDAVTTFGILFLMSDAVKM